MIVPDKRYLKNTHASAVLGRIPMTALIKVIGNKCLLSPYLDKV
ncbi:hypothetical protein [Vagococcus penaei]|nr:hypothetical protein [Vagococcus penaei]